MPSARVSVSNWTGNYGPQHRPVARIGFGAVVWRRDAERPPFGFGKGGAITGEPLDQHGGIGTPNGKFGLDPGGVKKLLQPCLVERTVSEQLAAGQALIHATGDLQYRPTGTP